MNGRWSSVLTFFDQPSRMIAASASVIPSPRVCIERCVCLVCLSILRRISTANRCSSVFGSGIFGSGFWSTILRIVRIIKRFVCYQNHIPPTLNKVNRPEGI